MAKVQIRRGIFETNSSSVHSITMCSENEYEKWKNGELIFDRSSSGLIPITNEKYKKWNEMSYEEKEKRWSVHDFLTFEEFFDYDVIEYEYYCKTYETPKGEKVIAFGYYGENM